MTTEALPEVPVEVTTPIKPSEAIRLGILITPIKLTGRIIDDNGGSCAVGAMALGYGWQVPPESERDDTDDWMTEGYDIASAHLPTFLPDPKNGYLPSESIDIIWLLNDDGDRDLDGWTREHIADWLEGQGL